MNHLQPHPSPAPRSLPSARALAQMALQLQLALQAGEPRADQRREARDAVDANQSAGAGWYESSFELGRGLLVLEVLPGAGEWAFQAA